MGDLHVVIDSTANASAELLAANANLHVVPLSVSLGGQQWRECDLTNAELFAAVQASGLHPKTSQPSPGDFAQVFSPLVQQGNQVIVITLSGGLSGTFESARAAALTVGEEQIKVIDSGTTAAGLVRMAKAALAAAAQGTALADVAGLLTMMRENTGTMFVPDTLEYLHKGGRIGGAAALLGSILQIRPVLFLTGGRVAVLDKVRTRSKAVVRMLEELNRCGYPVYVDVVHSEAEEAARLLANKVMELFSGVEVTVSACGAVLGAHVGPGLLGLVYQQSGEGK